MDARKYIGSLSRRAELFAEKVSAMAEKNFRDADADPDGDPLQALEDAVFGSCLALGQMLHGYDDDVRDAYMEACLKMLADKTVCSAHRLPKPTHWPQTTKPQ
jgi:hypothetical protein